MQSIEIMGVLNVTPDSFSDGGRFLNTKYATSHALDMQQQGADIIDIGGESSRPGAKVIEENEELERILPVISSLKASSPSIRISVDTYKPRVMSEVLSFGVDIINDIYGFNNTESLEVVSEHSCNICIIHMQGTPKTMQHSPHYNNIIDELLSFFESKLKQCEQYGINPQRIIIDPGFGFGKTYEHNIEIIRNLERFKIFGTKILIGISNKSIFDKILGGRVVTDRVAASTAFNQIAIEKGAHIIRTHNPKETADMLKVFGAIYSSFS